MDRLYGIKEAADALRVKPPTIHLWIRQGRLMPVKLGRRVVVTERELERFVDEGKVRRRGN